jgi:hypothetical protein
MARFNVANPARTRGVVTSPTTHSTGATFNGAPGFERDVRGELFLLATTNFVAQKTFYEDAKRRDSRFQQLVRQVAELDSRWTLEFLTWLRVGANMRTAALVAGIEAARIVSASRAKYMPAVVQAAGMPTARQMLDVVLQRADEPGEAIGYWLANYGRKLPIWFKRGIGDAVMRLYTPYTYAKWDSDRRDIRFADVIEWSQISRARGDNSGLFKYILDQRHGRRDLNQLPEGKARELLVSRWKFGQIPAERRREMLGSLELSFLMRQAGLTWEAFAGWLQGPMDAQAWETAIPQMGYGALLKNLRNFDEVGISPEARKAVALALCAPDAVARSRVLPMQFLNAYNNVRSDFWRSVLDEAATMSLGQIPRFPGRTLILVDTSYSMNERFTHNANQRSADGVEHLMRWDVAALFGLALAQASQDATVVSFSDGHSNFHHGRTLHAPTGSLVFQTRTGENLLAAVNRFRKTHFLGGGTQTKRAVDLHYQGHDRIVVLTDEQADEHGAEQVFANVPAKVPTYTFNLAGYRMGHAPSVGNRYTMGGLTDAGFTMIAALEEVGKGRWPWEVTSSEPGR